MVLHMPHGADKQKRQPTATVPPLEEHPDLQEPTSTQLNRYRDHERNVKTRILVIGGLVVSAVLIGGRYILDHSGPDGTVVPRTYTAEDYYNASRLQLATGPISNKADAAATLQAVLGNELYAEEHGDDDGYRAAFAQTVPNKYGAFAQQRVVSDRQRSALIVSGHQNSPKTYPTQTVEVPSVTSITPPNAGGAITIHAEADYVSNLPVDSVTPRESNVTVTGDYTLVQRDVTLENGSKHNIWVLSSLDNANVNQSPITPQQ